jgi:hypothetical protein
MSTYRVRVTRIPIQPKSREQMRAAGTLHEDHDRRELPVHDHSEVTTDSWLVEDAELIDLAMARTGLDLHSAERAWVHAGVDHGARLVRQGIQRRALELRVVDEAGSLW